MTLSQDGTKKVRVGDLHFFSNEIHAAGSWATCFRGGIEELCPAIEYIPHGESSRVYQSLLAGGSLPSRECSG